MSVLQEQRRVKDQELHDTLAEFDSLAVKLKLSESSKLALEKSLDVAQESICKMQHEVQVNLTMSIW